MTKKEYILKILEELKDDLSWANDMLISISEIKEEKNLDVMYNIFKKTVNQIYNEKIKKKIKKTIDKLQNIKKMEETERKKENDELLKLEEELGLI